MPDLTSLTISVRAPSASRAWTWPLPAALVIVTSAFAWGFFCGLTLRVQAWSSQPLAQREVAQVRALLREDLPKARCLSELQDLASRSQGGPANFSVYGSRRAAMASHLAWFSQDCTSVTRGIWAGTTVCSDPHDISKAIAHVLHRA